MVQYSTHDLAWYLNGQNEVRWQRVWYSNALWIPNKSTPSCFLMYWSSTQMVGIGHSTWTNHFNWIKNFIMFSIQIPTEGIYLTLYICRSLLLNLHGISWLSIQKVFYYPPSGISSCVKTVHTVMCLHTWRSPAIHFRTGSDSGLVSRLKIGFREVIHLPPQLYEVCSSERGWSMYLPIFRVYRQWHFPLSLFAYLQMNLNG